MNDSLVVRIRNRLAHLEQHTDRARDAPAVFAPMHRVEHLGQFAALDQLHREVGLAIVVDSQLVDRNDARMVELAGNLRLLEKTPERLGAALRRLPRARDDLHRQVAQEVLVPHAVDCALTAAGDLVHPFVALVPFAALDDAPQHRARRIRPAIRRCLARGRLVLLGHG